MTEVDKHYRQWVHERGKIGNYRNLSFSTTIREAFRAGYAVNTARIAELDNQLFEMTEMGVKQAQTIRTQQLRIAELEAQNKNLQFENNGMRELLQHFVLGYRQGRDLSAVYMDARTVLEKSA